MWSHLQQQSTIEQFRIFWSFTSAFNGQKFKWQNLPTLPFIPLISPEVFFSLLTSFFFHKLAFFINKFRFTLFHFRLFKGSKAPHVDNISCKFEEGTSRLLNNNRKPLKVKSAEDNEKQILSRFRVNVRKTFSSILTRK